MEDFGDSHETPASDPITLIPVGLKEASLDSPSFRSSFTHFAEQLELIEKWLYSYHRCISKLTHEIGPFESAINAFLNQTVPPLYISEALLDHDYTLVALKRYGEQARGFWTATLSSIRKMEAHMVAPLKAFLHGDLQSFKDVKRNVESYQKQLDGLQARFASQAKTKEPSSLREDAFQLHVARKAYLKACLDFSVAAPQLRRHLDKMLVEVFSDHWRDMRDSRLKVNHAVARWGTDIDRVRGWSRELENSERQFKSELEDARRQIEGNAEIAIRPSREIEDYTLDAITKQRGPSLSTTQFGNSDGQHLRAEKQGWLMLRTVIGKPSRTAWVRRWFYVKDGIFGWLVQGSRSGAVEESDRIGVLLCNVRLSDSDDRRYVFEVKTKDTTFIVQAETQSELSQWLSAFQLAKQKALEQPAIAGSQTSGSFAISPPSAPEFAASVADSAILPPTEDPAATIGVDRSSTLPVPGSDSVTNRNSFDVNAYRRPSGLDVAAEPTREPTSRLISRLDLHKRSTGSPTSPGLSGGGIATLLAATHGSMPVGPGVLPGPTAEIPSNRKSSSQLTGIRDMPVNSLAPSTLVNPPNPTNLSAMAVLVNGDRGNGPTRHESSRGIPSGLLANVWGSCDWGAFISRAEGESSRPDESPQVISNKSENSPPSASSGVTVAPSMDPHGHRKTLSLDGGDLLQPSMPQSSDVQYPNYYPAQLKMQDAQFRLMFPNVSSLVILVFKASWKFDDQQEFPGRIYVTRHGIYFYSNHLGMAMTTSVPLVAISEVTAANGRDWDAVFLHIDRTKANIRLNRIMMKTFLEPLKLLQRRLTFLVKDAFEGSILSLDEVMKKLIMLESQDSNGDRSDNSIENLSASDNIDQMAHAQSRFDSKQPKALKTNVLVNHDIYGNVAGDKNVAKSKSFKLPKQPVIFIPSKMEQLVVEKEYDVSPKVLYHVMFGDRSAVWQSLYYERQASHIRQGPWSHPSKGHMRREFEYEIEYLDLLRRNRTARVVDYQTIDIATEHLLYCISDRKTPWHLPYRKDFSLLSKIVITHMAKSKSKIGIYTKIEWHRPIFPFVRNLITSAALRDMETDALDLSDVLSDQVRRLVGAHGHTKKAIAIFGLVGRQTQVTEFAGSDAPLNARLRRGRRPRTLTGIVLQTFGSFMETIATSILMMIGNCVQWGWNTFSANYMILLLLGLSIILNMVATSRGTAEWWKERKAMNLMSRIGLDQRQPMRRAVYLHELEQVLPFDDELGKTPPASVCRSTFDDLMNLSEDTGLLSGPTSLPSIQASTALRLQRTRTRLGSRRHDLLVAMRVVNNVETELLRGEWERWLAEENSQCKQLGILLKKNATESFHGNTQMFSGRQKELGEWHDRYCTSCRKELEVTKE